MRDTAQEYRNSGRADKLLTCQDWLDTDDSIVVDYESFLGRMGFDASIGGRDWNKYLSYWCEGKKDFWEWLEKQDDNLIASNGGDSDND